MIKVLTWFGRKAGLSRREFCDYWRNEHPKAVLQMPGLRAYNQNPTTDAGYAKGEPFCDGVAETWWDDLEALHAHRGTAQLDALMADETHFINADRRHSLVVEEVVIIDGSPGADAIKQFTWLTRRPDLTSQQCQSYWRDHHGPLASNVPAMARYVQNHTVAHQYRDGRQPAFDGVAVAYLKDLETARAAARSPELAATRADEANFLDITSLPFIVATEIKIV